MKYPINCVILKLIFIKKIDLNEITMRFAMHWEVLTMTKSKRWRPVPTVTKFDTEQEAIDFKNSLKQYCELYQVNG